MTYVISDIHGHFDEFLEMLKKIEFKETDTLYVLGDMIDRGPKGIEGLQYIMNHPNIHMLLGNHEYMMLDVLSSPEIKLFRRSWYHNGGEITEYQFNNLSEKEQKEILDFVKGLPNSFDITVNDKRFILAHAQPEAKYYGKDYEPHQGFESETEYVVWMRDIPVPIKDAIIIYGHTPTFHYTEKGEIISYTDNRYNIDCGAAYPKFKGQLGCLRLDDMKPFYVKISPNA